METYTHNGRTFTLTADADFSSRVFPGGWHDAEDGEEYVSEWDAPAVDAEGEKYIVRFHFYASKGGELEPDYFPWDDEHIVDVFAV